MRKIRSTSSKPVEVKPIRANSGIEVAYRRRLHALTEEMQGSLVYWLSAAYKEAEGINLAQDDAAHNRREPRLPARLMGEAMAKIAAQWNARFEEGAQRLAAWFGQKTRNYADAALKKVLKDTGFSVSFTMTPAMQNTADAVVANQVVLIRSIGTQHLAKVETLVMQSVQAGRDLGTLTKQLQQQFGVTQRRAAFIARDQNNHATSAMVSTRQQGLGITQGKWRHSGAGREPRPEHVKADGKLFDLNKGLYLENQWILPGQIFNCRCTWAPVIPGFVD